ncbi:MAG: UbiA family prenyltransferase [Polyangiaceae bacterium]
MPTEPSLEDTLGDPSARSRPVCVALDGTLVTAQLFSERVALLFRQRPWLVLALPFWVLGGAKRMKQRVAKSSPLDPAFLPYRRPLVQALGACRQAGRKVVLAGASDPDLAQRVAEHLNLFDAVLVADRTAADLRATLLAEFPGGFDYVGHSSHDRPALEASTRGYLMGASAGTVSTLGGLKQVEVLSRRPSMLRALVKELRPHQWAKNALVVLPSLLASARDSMPIAEGLLAAGTFSLCASAGYVFNDLLDLDADRIHSSKAKRPFASGALPTVFGFPIFIGLLVLSFALASTLLPRAFVAMLALYFVGTVTYSLYLKRLLLLDVLVLAGLYTHRILAGGTASGVRVSAWLLGFSMFLFTSLAFAKRFVELHGTSSDVQVMNRGYSRVDIPMVIAMGNASGYVAALVFMLYVDSSAVRATYREPSILWLVLPVLLYWLGRIWLLAGRGKMQEDPVKFALSDRRSLACVGFIGAIAVAARFTPDWLIALLH